MLRELWVSNFVLVDRLHVALKPGLNALTGETGAGKSLVVGALELVLGGRASADMIRQGEAEAEVAVRFELPAAHFQQRRLDQSLEEGSLLLRRVVSRDGRSRAYVNDRPATVGRLRELGATLADLHGQHEQQNILREESHLEYLDGFAGVAEAARSVGERYREFQQARAALAEFQEAGKRSAREREFAEFQLRELEDAELREGEEEDLLRERHLAAHGARLAEAVGEAVADLVDGETSVESLLARASRALGQAIRIDPGLEALRRQVDEALVASEEAGRELNGYLDRLEVDPERLEVVEGRLDRLARLRRKYDATIPELMVRCAELRRELDLDGESGMRQRELEEAVRAASDRLHGECAALSGERSRAAARFSRAVTRELAGLGMDGARFQVELKAPAHGELLSGRTDPVGPRGAETASFILTANAGEPPGPLARTASGGEASRVMLALKNVLRRADPVPLVIFDEVDAGIGGVVAEAVGERLASIARERQVLVITHLAVIASRAEHHLRLVKTRSGKRTQVEIESLAGEGREQELARMLAGRAGGEDARRTARALLGEESRP